VTKRQRSHGDDLRGASRLAVEATRGVMALVEELHATIASGPVVLGRPLEVPARAITGLVYGGIRGVTGVVGKGLDVALQALAPTLGESAPGPEREALLAAINGVLGDYLVETGNPLAISMRLRSGGRPLELERGSLAAAFPGATGKVLVLVHGSAMNDLQWRRLGHDHGAALARDLGYTPVYLHYNSGLHVSTNGEQLSALLEALVAAWPVKVESVTLLGHSMGGLVARSACHAAEAAGHAWRGSLAALVCLGTPHHGAPLERGGNWIDTLLAVSRYSAPFAMLGKIRSAGVTDLRFGNVLDAHWRGRDRFELGRDPRSALRLPDGVACYAVAATTANADAARLPGDGLVPLASALGRHSRPELTLAFPAEHQWVGYGMGHLELLSRPEVYQTLVRWLGER
jgi:pimeloyl-ACP methyl ester carboxylesterase